MRWSKDLYLGLGVRSTPKQCRQEIEQGTGKYFVITLSPNGRDNLDIRPALSLQKESLRSLDVLIVAVAADRKDALSLLERIASDCWMARGDANLRAYLQD